MTGVDGCIIHEGMYYVKLPDGGVHCHLCPHECRFRPGGQGRCRVRANLDGSLVARNYGLYSALAVDPVEKKPLYHFHPGKTILSAGTIGCNFHCEFCQNWEIAHTDPPVRHITPEELVQAALQEAGTGDCIGIAYTYSEPLMWYEFVLDTARLARKQGLKNVLVTNGFIRQEPLRELLPLIDAVNIDVKGFTSEFYCQVVHGRYEPVLATAETACREGCHVEITTLLIPGMNDSDEEIERLVEWVAGSLSPDVPLHFSRYFPHYKMQLAPTPVATLKRAREIARRRLNYVYLGNVAGVGGSDTVCPQCGQVIIKRTGYRVRTNGLVGNRCVHCDRRLPVITGEATVR